jgi:hypothetical protein
MPARVIHRTVAIGHTVNVRDAIEHQSGLDAAFQYFRHQFVHVGTNWRRTDDIGPPNLRAKAMRSG